MFFSERIVRTLIIRIIHDDPGSVKMPVGVIGLFPAFRRLINISEVKVIITARNGRRIPAHLNRMRDEIRRI
mgnify:CR=1 FL=1